MHSLTDTSYTEIKAAVLSFICQGNVGTYVRADHVLVIDVTETGYHAAYRIGPHNWKFDFSENEVQSGIN